MGRRSDTGAGHDQPEASVNLLRAYRRWRLRRAREKYAYWKGRREMLEHQLKDSFFASNPHNRNCAIHAAGNEAKFMERVEIFMREPQ